MDGKLSNLIKAVSVSRQQLIHSVSGLSPAQAQFKPSSDVWSVIDNVEHLYWAEFGGINGIWRATEALKSGKPHWTGEAIHRGRSIEEIVNKTWQPKEVSPDIAKPRWGGTLQFWTFSLNSCQPLLEKLGEALIGMDLEFVVHPHPISGPLDVLQRMEFLRFHLDRHMDQIENIKQDSNFPKLNY